ncbi:MAG: M28 family metallopeptidase, partial [Promethearchaeota archaeon]
MTKSNTINHLNIVQKSSSETASDMSPYGPPISEFHTVLSNFKTRDWTEDIEHYRNLVKFFSQTFPNRGWQDEMPHDPYENNTFAVEWFEEKLRNVTNDEIEPLPGQSSFRLGQWQNIVGVIPTTNPSSTAILIGGHIDSEINTPGADDNASGAMAILEIARLLTESNMSFNTNLILCGFNREEISRSGSKELAEYLATNQPFDIQLVINFDMLLNQNKGETNKIDIIFDADQEYENGSYWGGLFNATSYNYGANFIRTNSSSDDWRWKRSDHYSFTTWGFPSLFLIEANMTDRYHRPTDVWNTSTYNYTQAFEVILSTLGVLSFIEETTSTFHGFHVQINSTNHQKFLIVPEEDSVIAARSWDYRTGEEPLFIVKTADGEPIADANWIVNSSLSYWVGSLENESVIIEINERASDINLEITVGLDTNDNSFPDIWENAFESLGSEDSDDDNDGLTNFEEFSFNLHPQENDSDNDGWEDETEIQRGTNPRDSKDYPGSTSSTSTSVQTTFPSTTTSTSEESPLTTPTSTDIISSPETTSPPASSTFEDSTFMDTPSSQQKLSSKAST